MVGEPENAPELETVDVPVKKPEGGAADNNGQHDSHHYEVDANRQVQNQSVISAEETQLSVFERDEEQLKSLEHASIL